jgi:hypothetical protein
MNTPNTITPYDHLGVRFWPCLKEGRLPRVFGVLKCTSCECFVSQVSETGPVQCRFVGPALDGSENIASFFGGKVYHSVACLQAQRAFNARQVAFANQYPHYCRLCGATGGRSVPATHNDPGDWIDCKGCTDKGACPRCGAELPEDADTPCYGCGWLITDDDPDVFYQGCCCWFPDDEIHDLPAELEADLAYAQGDCRTADERPEGYR